MSTEVKHLFGRIAGRYDLLNRLLSARRDVAWRASALGLLRGSPGILVDLACGTFDFGLQALAAGKARVVHGSDFCQPMLVAGAAKRAGRPLSASVGDALRLPFADGAADVVTVAYGWRNFDDPAAALAEMRRVLAADGEVLILEFFRPQRRWPRLFYASFGRVVFPLLGGLVGGDAGAYRYLNDSVRRFLSIDEARALVAASGFADVRVRSFFAGVSHAIVARAPARASPPAAAP
jgi:demethylmenaquinone methyltransferase/2-methoxy-6-polyprenyl-1,4-benzoquinol methylase